MITAVFSRPLTLLLVFLIWTRLVVDRLFLVPLSLSYVTLLVILNEEYEVLTAVAFLVLALGAGHNSE